MSKGKRPETDEEWETFVLSIIASLCLCDHMGDVSNDILTILGTLGHEPDIEWDELGDLLPWLHRRGIKTLHGTDIGPDEEESR